MKTKQTSRRWSIEDEGVYESINEDIGNGARYSFAHIKFNGSVDYVRKYRQLIAAAPELLDLATELFDSMSKDSLFVNKYAGVLMDLDKAIKKAKGE